MSDVLLAVWQLAVPTLGLPQETAARAVLVQFDGVLAGPVGAGPGRPDPWACLGAALLEPYIWTVLPAVVQPSDRDLLQELSRIVAEPAAAVCRLAVTQLFDAA